MEKDRRISKRKTRISIVLAAVSVVLAVSGRIAPGFAQWYGTHLYPLWVGSIGRFMGYFPFSVSEMLLYVLLAWVIWGIAKSVGRRAADCLLGLVFLAASKQKKEGTGARYLLYVVNCGINYHKNSFSETSGIRANEYTAEELREVCQWLTEQVSVYSGKVERGSEGEMLLDIPAGEYAVKTMEELGREYPELAGYYPQPKKLVNSWILSVQHLSGIYSPFTIEANYNGDMQDYYIPFTACHELSHLRGFMQEQEANFIAFLACSKSGEDAFAYSGYLSGWIQCMNVLYKTDYDAWKEVRGTLPPEAEADLRLNREFWAKYDGAIAEVSNKVNDTYLKANGQKDGVKSYNRMVDLIVAYYHSEVR